MHTSSILVIASLTVLEWHFSTPERPDNHQGRSSDINCGHMMQDIQSRFEPNPVLRVSRSLHSPATMVASSMVMGLALLSWCVLSTSMWFTSVVLRRPTSRCNSTNADNCRKPAKETVGR